MQFEAKWTAPPFHPSNLKRLKEERLFSEMALFRFYLLVCITGWLWDRRLKPLHLWKWKSFKGNGAAGFSWPVQNICLSFRHNIKNMTTPLLFHTVLTFILLKQAQKKSKFHSNRCKINCFLPFGLSVPLFSLC